MHLHRTLHDLGGNDVIGDVLSHHGHNERPQRQHGLNIKPSTVAIAALTQGPTTGTKCMMPVKMAMSAA